MARAAALLTLLLPALATAQLGKRGETYCVGGYEGRPPFVVAACARPEIEQQHRQWHVHVFVMDTQSRTCSLCYDEVDDTCETVFLRRNPRYRAVDGYECAQLGEQHTSDQVLSHVIDGREVSAPPPPPKPVELEAKVERISSGPYTAGDRISLTGAVRDDTGTLRQVTGGTFRVTDAKGGVTELPGKVQQDGRVTAEYTLPPTEGLKVEFVPKVAPGANEVLRSAASEAQSLKVEVCGLRARVVSPEEGQSLVSEERVSLRAALLDMQGTPLPAQPPGTTLEFQVQVEGEAARTLPADGSLEAGWTPPRSGKPQQPPRPVRISVSGRSGDRVVCPEKEVVMTVSDLGLAFDTSELPSTCYVGLPCRGTVKLKRPEPGPGRAQVDRKLSEPGLSVELIDTGRTRKTAPSADDRYTFEETYTEVKSASWSLVLRSSQGEEVAAMPGHPVQVRPALKLQLPTELDFGIVAAGTAVTAACQRLDFGKSQAVEEHEWELRAEGLQGCQSRPVLYFRNESGVSETRPLQQPITVNALDPQHRWLDVCLEVPRCAADASPAGAVLHVVPKTPLFKSQAATVRLRWRVEGRGLLGCHAFWLLPTLGGLGAVVLLAGFTRPARFGPGAAVRIAGSERGIRQAASVLLRACPGSSPGFFRDARLGMQGDGNVTGRVRGAAVVLRAVQGGGLVLTGTGPVERQDRRTLKWEPVDDLGPGHVPSPGTLYRAGGTYFQVEI